MITAGVPYFEIHVLKKVVIIVSAELSGIGVASGYLVVLSIIVRQYRNLFEGGRRPTISKCICENFSSGTGICSGIRLLCICIFVGKLDMFLLSKQYPSAC